MWDILLRSLRKNLVVCDNTITGIASNRDPKSLLVDMAVGRQMKDEPDDFIRLYSSIGSDLDC